MNATEWNALPRELQEEHTMKRKRSGHTAVGVYERLIIADARTQAMNEACDWLAANGFPEASSALEKAAFEP